MALGAFLLAGCCSTPTSMGPDFHNYTLDFRSPVDAALQSGLEQIDAELHTQFGMATGQTAVGLLDLRGLRLAMIRPDQIEYAASIAKIGILLAYFQFHPEAATNLDSATRHALGLMTKASDNQSATRFSRELGLTQIQTVIDSYGLYDREHGGGLWLGKHYGRGDERITDPVGGYSHAATVRQVMRFFLLLEQGRLVSTEASATMRQIFESPDIPPDEHKFVLGLKGRPVDIIRKWGSWEDWLHDAAVVKGRDRHYILVGLTRHRNGDAYLVALAQKVDDLMSR
jgi:beta-lactamase class A